RVTRNQKTHSKTLNGTTICTTYAYDAANRLIQTTEGANTTDYTVDAAGRQTAVTQNSVPPSSGAASSTRSGRTIHHFQTLAGFKQEPAFFVRFGQWAG
ncbi:MAG: hypothetical protein AAF902_05195, partial [Chloroflexota bacterium]